MTVQYRCNVCNRTIDVAEKTSSLDVFGKCIITKQCKGTLFFIKRNDNILRPLPPDTVAGLPDWQYTPQVATFDQKHARSVWKFKHNLTAVPSIIVYISTVDADNKPTNIKLYEPDYTFSFTDEYIEISFSANNQGIIPKFSGTLQCVVRTSSSVKQVVAQSDNFIKISNNSILSFCVHTHNKLYVANDTGVYNNALSILLNEVEVNYPLGNNLPGQAWGDVDQVYMYGNNYAVNTLNIILNDNSPSTIHNFSAYRYVGENPMMYILLSNSSNYIDKVYDKVVNIFELNINNNYVRNNELYVSESIIRDCYPHVILV